MLCIFQTKSKEQNRYSIAKLKVQLDGEERNFGKVIFNNGVKSTSDKDFIRALMKYDGYKRGDYDLVTNKDLVAEYLEGNQPDSLTQEMLDNITMEGVKRLGEILGAKNEQAALIKLEIEGSPITNKVQELLDFHQTKLNKKEPKSEIETFEIKTSTEMSVREALKYMKDVPVEKLKNFLDDDEDRKTILDEYKKLTSEE